MMNNNNVVKLIDAEMANVNGGYRQAKLRTNNPGSMEDVWERPTTKSTENRA